MEIEALEAVKEYILENNSELWTEELEELDLFLKSAIDNRVKENKFWVIVTEEMQLFTDKEKAIEDMQETLVGDSEASLAEISWLEEEKKFDVNPVSWKEMNVALAKHLTRLKEQLRKAKEKEEEEEAKEDND